MSDDHIQSNSTRTNRPIASRRTVLRSLGIAAGVSGLGTTAATGSARAASLDPNEPGILEPVKTKLSGNEVRVPETDQISDGELHQVVSHTDEDAEGATSVRGHEITQVSNPHEDLATALETLARVAAGSSRPWPSRNRPISAEIPQS